VTERDASTEPTPTSGTPTSSTDRLGTGIFEPAPAGAASAATERLDARTVPLDAGEAAGGAAVPEEATASAAAAGVAEPRPRIRFAGIAWGVLLATAALVLLGIVASPSRRAAAAEWLGSLQGDTVAIILAIVFGAVLVLSALLASVRRLQRERAEH
jgi:uncharacterized integral membrane protein